MSNQLNNTAMAKLTFEEFCNAMYKANETGQSLRGVIVFAQESFTKKYSLETRSYRVYSHAKYFDASAAGNSLFGYCLDDDPREQAIRLDYYIRYCWKIEYCYLIED